MPVILYERQRQILDFIVQYIQKNRFAPTLRDMADAMGLNSLATVHEHVQQLEKKGVLKITGKGKNRKIEVVDEKLRGDEGIRLPILGYVTNQDPIKPYDDPNAFFNASPSLVKVKRRAFALEVKGDGLLADAVLDKDILIMEEEAKVVDGDIVVALLEDNTAVLKKFFQEETRVRLESLRGRENPIYITKVRIQGRVQAIVRKF